MTFSLQISEDFCVFLSFLSDRSVFSDRWDNQELSDPRNRNHKLLAIGNHNFEVASFSRRNRSKIAMSQSQKPHWAQTIAAIQL